ncbi:MAG TPA: NAAT family transporter [Bacteroidales bacterium]|nr:NAAT family transporter [Bacteroidales bacterium]
MDHLFTAFVLYFTSFFTIINPIGSMPVFLTMTATLDQKARSRTALKAVITAFITLLIFAFGGQLLFGFFGISVNAFRIVGGIIFFVMGYEMLHARLSRIKITDQEVKEYVDDISVTPLGIPMIAGPGAITNAIVLMEDASDIQHQAAMIASVLVTLGLTLVFYLSGARVVRFLGETGNKILLKLMGLIVMVIAVEFFLAGIKPVIQDMLGIG